MDNILELSHLEHSVTFGEHLDGVCVKTCSVRCVVLIGFAFFMQANSITFGQYMVWLIKMPLDD